MARLKVDLIVDDKGKKVITGFGSEVDRVMLSSKLSVASLGKALAVGGAALTAMFATVITSANQAREMENLARLAKTTGEEFRGLAYATEAVGISAEQLADISKDVQDKLGDFIATGGGGFKDFFENVAPQVGLTAKELQHLSGPDVLVAVKKAMDDANISAEEQVFYLEAIGNDTTKLIPLLEKNGQALKEKAARARELGVALSEIDNSNLIEAGAATKETITAFGALKNAIAAEFAPVVTDVMSWVTETIIEWKDELRSLAGSLVNIAESFVGWKAVFEGRLSFFEFARMDAEEFGVWLEANRVKAIEFGDAGAAAQGVHQQGIQTTTESLKEQDRVRQELIEKHKAEAREQGEAERQMYQEAGFGADAYFNQQAKELVEKAARWQNAGAKTYDVEQWLWDELGKLATEAYAKEEFAAGQAMESMQHQNRTLVEQFNAAGAAAAGAMEAMQVQNHAMVEQFHAANLAISQQMESVWAKADALDGKTIQITALFDGGMVTSGIDALIAKFQQLRAAAADVPDIPSGGSPQSSSYPDIPDLGPQSSSYENTDPARSAAQVAAEQSAYNPSRAVTINVNQSVSRSDVVSIASELARVGAR